MDDEYNNLNTENTKTTFSNNTDNLGTSDELNAAAIYSVDKDTQYARAKRLRAVIIAVGASLLLVGTAIGFHNAFIADPPKVVNFAFTPSESSDSISYSFSVVNIRKYKVTLIVTIPEQEDFTLDVSSQEDYSGTLSNLGYNKTIKYKIDFFNRIDYKQTLVSGSVTTIMEA